VSRVCSLLTQSRRDHMDAQREACQAAALVEACQAAGVEHAVWSSLEDTRAFAKARFLRSSEQARLLGGSLHHVKSSLRAAAQQSARTRPQQRN
jgi:hypothetical protein